MKTLLLNTARVLTTIMIAAFAGSCLFRIWTIFAVGQYAVNAPIFLVAFMGLVAPICVIMFAVFLTYLIWKKHP